MWPIFIHIFELINQNVKDFSTMDREIVLNLQISFFTVLYCSNLWNQMLYISIVALLKF